MRQLKITSKITNRESLALDKYLQDISKIDMLSVDEEAELARRIRDGDEHALEILTKSNLRFVVSVAKQYQNQGLSLADLINEGNVGLIKAARRFDETRGFKFISYAVWWVRQSILQAIVEHSRIVRLPVNKSASYHKVNQAFMSFVQEFEREPSHQELADLLNITPKDVGSLLQGGGRHLSFDAPISEDDDSSTMLDLIASDDVPPDLSLMEESLQLEVMNGLSALSPREVDVIKAYFGLSGTKPMSLDEMSETFGLTRERVRQIKERALRRLRKSFRRNRNT